MLIPQRYCIPVNFDYFNFNIFFKITVPLKFKE